MNPTNTTSMWKVIGASSLGTLIEWYDFYLFGSLAVTISTKFFPQADPTAAFLSTLATFAAGFVVRPFGALVFGRIGDLIGRKYTFMVTLLIMGSATFLIGCIPGYETIGFAAPLLVLLLRLLQGLALGGEYGGAATYVAEHAPAGRRGYWTSWIQTTATIGLFVSLVVILLTRGSMTRPQFDEWGWRVPFWVSILLVVVSYFIRRRMHESPLFAKAKAEGQTSSNPLKESFGNRLNLKFVLLALFGAVMGQGVVWYTGQFYALSFIQKVCNVDSTQTDALVAVALLAGSPFFIVFGALSDRIGRKKVLLAGMLLAICSYRPIYNAMFQAVNVKHKTELTELQQVSSSDKTLPNGDITHTTKIVHLYSDNTSYTYDSLATIKADQGAKPVPPKVTKTILLCNCDKWFLILMVFIQVIFVTMVYGPVAAFLVELFPVRIRYTSMSLPYHIGNGIFGGLLPAVATYLATESKKAGVATWYLDGLWYPIIIGSVCFIIGLVYINGKKETRHH